MTLFKDLAELRAFHTELLKEAEAAKLHAEKLKAEGKPPKDLRHIKDYYFNQRRIAQRLGIKVGTKDGSGDAPDLFKRRIEGQVPAGKAIENEKAQDVFNPKKKAEPTQTGIKNEKPADIFGKREQAIQKLRTAPPPELVKTGLKTEDVLADNSSKDDEVDDHLKAQREAEEKARLEQEAKLKAEMEAGKTALDNQDDGTEDPAGTKEETDAADPEKTEDPAGTKEETDAADPEKTEDPAGTKEETDAADPEKTEDPAGDEVENQEQPPADPEEKPEETEDDGDGTKEKTPDKKPDPKPAKRGRPKKDTPAKK